MLTIKSGCGEKCTLYRFPQKLKLLFLICKLCFPEIVTFCFAKNFEGCAFKQCVKCKFPKDAKYSIEILVGIRLKKELKNIK